MPSYTTQDIRTIALVRHQGAGDEDLRHHHGLVPSKVVPNVQQSATRYLVPDDRDFFAVYRRLPGPLTVPFK